MMTTIENNGFRANLELISEGRAKGQFFATAELQVGAKRMRWTVPAADQQAALVAADRKAREWFAEFSE